MQTTVATRVTISAKPTEVFDFLTDLKNHYLWNPQTHKISRTGKLKLGSEFISESVVLGTPIKCHNVVTKFVAPGELVIENEVGSVVYKARFVLKEKGKGTLVTLSTTLSTDAKVWVFTMPVLKQLALRELRTDLQALKVSIENNIAS